MKNANQIDRADQTAPQPTQILLETQPDSGTKTWLKKLRGGLFLTVGYLLSPLCWWNDLFFNLPIAYAFGYICSWISPDWLFPGSIVGYWLSNIVGILLMQFGAVDVLTNKPKETNLKKELLVGFASSTAFTVVVVALVYFKVLDIPDIFASQDSVNLGSILPMVLVSF
ncbi:MAG: hypothetical protein MUE44_15395 [Oscillatoriaceae cyanobacterium Prado104]|nr:hypothetical protein [Oscillatoriaceae cyanobacterium Prado104]